MTVAIEVRDDPEHPEGGHALILFRDAPDPGGEVTLLVDPLTEGFDYRGPRRIDVSGRATPDGFEIGVGPEVVSALPPGIATSLGLAGSSLFADVRWPILAQKAAEPRRRVIATQTRRIVVTGTGAATTSPPRRLEPAPARLSNDPVRVPDPPKPLDPRTPIGLTKPPHRQPPASTGDGRQVDSEPMPEPKSRETAPPKTGGRGALENGSGDAGGALVREPTEVPERLKPSIREPRPAAGGWRTGSVAAVALLAFIVGAGGVGGFWFSRPTPVAEPAVMPALPSPYAMLSTLSDRSPGGVRVDAREAKEFRLRGDKAKSPEEADFWHEWATKNLLTGKTGDAAATLSDFATGLASGHGVAGGRDAPAFAAARFLWEMAALASDCAAMDNIAAALSRGGQPGTDPEASVWRDRAKLCRSATKTAR